jgi:hypothetical protein
VRHRVPELLLAAHPRRIERERVARGDILPESSSAPAAVAHQPGGTRRPAEERVERVGVHTALDGAGHQPDRGRVTRIDQGTVGPPLARCNAVEPARPPGDVQQELRRLGSEDAAVHPEDVHRPAQRRVGVGQRYHRRRPAPAFAPTHRSDERVGLGQTAVGRVKDQASVGDDEPAGPRGEAPRGEESADLRSGWETGPPVPVAVVHRCRPHPRRIGVDCGVALRVVGSGLRRGRGREGQREEQAESGAHPDQSWA